MRPRILVIDDEALLGQTIQLGLEDALDVELELSGARALKRLLSGESFQLVLCDLSLPDVGGIEIHQQVVDKLPELEKRFVIMTGGAVSVESADFLDSYRGPRLDKPFTLSDVERLVHRLLEAYFVAAQRLGMVCSNSRGRARIRGGDPQ